MGGAARGETADRRSSVSLNDQKTTVNTTVMTNGSERTQYAGLSVWQQDSGKGLGTVQRIAYPT